MAARGNTSEHGQSYSARAPLQQLPSKFYFREFPKSSLQPPATRVCDPKHATRRKGCLHVMTSDSDNVQPAHAFVTSDTASTMRAMCSAGYKTVQSTYTLHKTLALPQSCTPRATAHFNKLLLVGLIHQDGNNFTSTIQSIK